ncbi:MAG: DUF4337 domain-containing protein [Pseudomonadota bacterium]
MEGSARKDRHNNLIAITVALISVFMAIAKVKDDNIVQAMQMAKSNAIDTWGEYQAKKLKLHLAEMGVKQCDSFLALKIANSAAQLQVQKESYAGEVKRYGEEAQVLKDKAQGFEKEYDSLNFKDDQFDIADAALSISLGTLAVSALITSSPILYLSWSSGAFGFVMGMAGILGWNFHPDWLAKLLS